MFKFLIGELQDIPVVVSMLALVPAEKSAALEPVTGCSSARTSSVTVSAAVLPVLPVLLPTTADDFPVTMLLLLLLVVSLFGLELLAAVEVEEEDGRVSPLLAEFWRYKERLDRPETAGPFFGAATLYLGAAAVSLSLFVTALDSSLKKKLRNLFEFHLICTDPLYLEFKTKLPYVPYVYN
jgi:hypothetical protein